ncbi:MAG TPA: aminopeptidase [Polyangiales bacterium]|nr:aminopeptidase [Polyangiales bacterium]
MRKARLLACFLCSLCSGCSLLSLAQGQLSLINDQLPLPAAIARERDPERQRLLAEVPAILAFAEDVIGLHPGQSYQGYFATERSGLTYVVTACERTRFEPYSWWFPIVGTVEYRSYWDEAEAQAAAAQLEEQGFDTWISPSRAYSSLGILRDPVATTMLKDGLPGLVEVLIHELTHARLFVPGQTAWNEALASFVGELGAEQYFSVKRFAGSSLQQRSQTRAQRRAVFESLTQAAYAELERLYASDLPEARKLQLRAARFEALTAELRKLYPDEPQRDLRVNNARLVHFQRYSATGPDIAELWAKSGGSFRRFWLLAEARAQQL